MKRGMQWLLSRYQANAAEVAAACRRGLEPLVLEDLARFRRADQSSHTPGDPYTTAFWEGQRNVWLHIGELIGLTPAEIDALTQYRQGDLDHG